MTVRAEVLASSSTMTIDRLARPLLAELVWFAVSSRQQMLWEWQKVPKTASGAAPKPSSESLELDRVICHRVRLMLVVLSQWLAKFRFPFWISSLVQIEGSLGLSRLKTCLALLRGTWLNCRYSVGLKGAVGS